MYSARFAKNSDLLLEEWVSERFMFAFESDIEDSLFTLFRVGYKDIIEAYGLEKVLDP